MVFFLSGGPTLWVMSAVSIFMAGAGGIALGTLDAELFPTEVRSTSNAMLYVVGGARVRRSGSLHRGRALAISSAASAARSRSPASASLLVALFVVPLLPESAARIARRRQPDPARQRAGRRVPSRPVTRAHAPP